MSIPVQPRLVFDDTPTPAPTPRPVVVPVPSPSPASPAWWQIAPWVVVLAFGIGFGWEYYKNRPTPGPAPTPTVDAVTLGKTFAPKLAASLADGFETAATMIAAGTSVKEADESLKVKFQASRNDAFKTMVAPEFAKVLPEGQEPKDPATREAAAKIHRDFASGLRGAK